MFKYKNIVIILEMNSSNRLIHVNKNYWYLFLEHSSRLNNKNKYTQDLQTILINIDSYDVLKQNNLIYDSILDFSKYNQILYFGIRIIHINLDYLNKKYYNKDKLNSFEKAMLIFIERDYEKLKKIQKRRDVLKIMDFMNTIIFNKNGIPVYDKEEFDRIYEEDLKTEHEQIKRIMSEVKTKQNNLKTRENNLETRENNLETRENNLETRENNLEVQQQTINDKQKQVEIEKMKLDEEKIILAKELKNAGFPINKILKITKLSKNKILML